MKFNPPINLILKDFIEFKKTKQKQKLKKKEGNKSLFIGIVICEEGYSKTPPLVVFLLMLMLIV
jgi:hypothetical protein